MKRKKIVRIILLLISGMGLAISFNNCGKGKSADQGSAALNLSSNIYNAADVCNEKEIDVFDRGYHQFLAETCKNCHISGPGKGTFASPDATAAFSGFTMLGYDKISQYAVNGSHNPPYTGTQNTEIINSLRLQWQTYQKDKLKCDNSTGGGSTAPAEPTVFTPQFETSAQMIPPIEGTPTTAKVNGADVVSMVYTRKTLTWDLNKELVALGAKAIPNLNGVSISMNITGFQIPSGQTSYLISLPMLKVGGYSLHIKGLNFRINGFPVSYATTFKKIDSNVYMGSTALLSPGSLVAVGPLGKSDTLSLQFGDIEIVNIPAPPPPPNVQFAVTSMTIQPNQLGYANKVTIQVQVTGDNVDPISVPVNFLAENMYPAGETAALGVLGIGQNRFDWDYQVDPTTSASLNFLANQKSASFNIIFSDDLRHDVDKVLRLSLGSPLGGVVGTNATLKISLPNYNPVYSGNAPTFALLMNPKSGVLGVNCVKCHNSVKKDTTSGYDMTDYEGMKKRGIIVPGNLDASQHKMFRRMNADDPNLLGLQSMPLDGFLPRDYVDLVNLWIRDGAKNN